MNWQAIVNGMAVGGIVCLGMTAVLGHLPDASQVATVAVSGLVGFIGGVATGKSPPSPPASGS